MLSADQRFARISAPRGDDGRSGDRSSPPSRPPHRAGAPAAGLRSRRRIDPRPGRRRRTPRTESPPGASTPPASFVRSSCSSALRFFGSPARGRGTSPCHSRLSRTTPFNLSAAIIRTAVDDYRIEERWLSGDKSANSRRNRRFHAPKNVRAGRSPPGVVDHDTGDARRRQRHEGGGPDSSTGPDARADAHADVVDAGNGAPTTMAGMIAGSSPAGPAWPGSARRWDSETLVAVERRSMPARMDSVPRGATFPDAAPSPLVTSIRRPVRDARYQLISIFPEAKPCTPYVMHFSGWRLPSR